MPMSRKADCGGHKGSEAGITGVQYSPVQGEREEASVISGKQFSLFLWVPTGTEGHADTRSLWWSKRSHWSLGFLFEQPSRTINYGNRWGTECASVLQLVKERDGESEAHYAEKQKHCQQQKRPCGHAQLWAAGQTHHSGETRLKPVNAPGCFADASAQTRRHIKLSTNKDRDVDGLEDAGFVAYRQLPVLYQRTIE